MPLVFRNELTCHIGLELNIWIRTIGQANAIERVGEPLSHGGGTVMVLLAASRVIPVSCSTVSVTLYVPRPGKVCVTGSEGP